MIADKFPSDKGVFLSGRITIVRGSFFYRTIPIVIHATQNDVAFTIRHGKASAKMLSYDKIHMAALSNFMGLKKVIIHADSGVEAIRCSESAKKISEFCKFVNDKIASRHQKTLAPKYQLTQLEAPPGYKLQSFQQVPEDHDSALDLLFHPDKFGSDFLESISRNINIDDSKQCSHDKKSSTTRKDILKKGAQNKYDLFSKYDEKVWNFTLGRERIRQISLGILVVLLGILAVRELSDMGGPSPADRVTTAAAKNPAISPPPNPPPEQLARDEPPRALALLVGIVHDDRKYHEFIGLLKGGRMKLGLSTRELSQRLGWSEQSLIDMESEASRADPMELIDYAVATDGDIQNIVESIK